MPIRVKLILTILLAIALVSAQIVILSFSSKEINQLVSSARDAAQISRNIFDLESITNQYLVDNETRPITQWTKLHQITSFQLDQTNFHDQESNQIAQRMQNELIDLKTIFSKLVEAREQEEAEQKLVSQLRNTSQNLVNDAFSISDILENQRSELRRETDSLVFLFSVSVVVIITLLNLFLSWSIFHAFRELSQGIDTIAQGNFSHRITIKGRDETKKIADGFNSMASQLDELYRNLEKKVADRTAEIAAAKAKDDAILASIGEGLIVTDTNRKVVKVNQAALQMLEVDQKEVLGKIWPENILGGNKIVMTSDHKQKIPELPIIRALKTKKNINHKNISYITPQNKFIPVFVTVSPLYLDKSLFGTVIVFRDVTKEFEIDKAKTEFVSLASHQLRTPLSIINWYSELLLSEDAGKLTKEQKEYLEKSYEGSKRMVELVNALLNVSRIELGTFTVEPANVKLKILIKNLIKEQKPQITTRGLQLSQDLADIEPIKLDLQLTRIVLHNLISNAIKYTPRNGTISLQLEEIALNQEIAGKKIPFDGVLFTISDSGIGIPEDQQDKIFTKLFRADNVKEKDTDGTGLGLYIAKAIIEHTGGLIWFTSNLAKKQQTQSGTSFYVAFPKVGMKNKKGSKQLI